MNFFPDITALGTDLYYLKQSCQSECRNQKKGIGLLNYLVTAEKRSSQNARYLNDIFQQAVLLFSSGCCGYNQVRDVFFC